LLEWPELPVSVFLILLQIRFLWWKIWGLVRNTRLRPWKAPGQIRWLWAYCTDA
jgi:hypothetical protein